MPEVARLTADRTFDKLCHCRTDLDALKKRLETPGKVLSSNDLLVGLNWTMRCILAGTPLLGQASDFVSPSQPNMHVCHFASATC